MVEVLTTAERCGCVDVRYRPARQFVPVPPGPPGTSIVLPVYVWRPAPTGVPSISPQFSSALTAHFAAAVYGRAQGSFAETVDEACALLNASVAMPPQQLVFNVTAVRMAAPPASDAGLVMHLLAVAAVTAILILLYIIFEL